MWELNGETQAMGPVNSCPFSYVALRPLPLSSSLLEASSTWMLLAVTSQILGAMLEVLELGLYLDALALLLFYTTGLLW